MWLSVKTFMELKVVRSTEACKDNSHFYDIKPKKICTFKEINNLFDLNFADTKAKIGVDMKRNPEMQGKKTSQYEISISCFFLLVTQKFSNNGTIRRITAVTRTMAAPMATTMTLIAITASAATTGATTTRMTQSTTATTTAKTLTTPTTAKKTQKKIGGCY